MNTSAQENIHLAQMNEKFTEESSPEGYLSLFLSDARGMGHQQLPD